VEDLTHPVDQMLHQTDSGRSWGGGMRVQDVARIQLGTIVRPPDETGTGGIVVGGVALGIQIARNDS
jgi:hypothetical protein